MKYLFIAFLFISSFISGQGIEPTSFQPTQYQGGILRGVIPYVDEFTGETLYIYQHVDSLVFIKDSIYVRNDSIFLRDGTGFAIVTDSIYNVSGATKDTIKLRDGSGYVLMTKGNITKVTGTSPIIIADSTSTPNVTIQNASTTLTGALTSTDWNTFNGKIGGTGVTNKVAWFNSANTLSTNNLFHWDNVNGMLAIGNTNPVAALDVTGKMQLQNATGSVYIGNLVGSNTETNGLNLGIGLQNLRNITT